MVFAFIHNQLTKNQNFDMIQAVLNVFLKNQSVAIIESEELTLQANQLAQLQSEKWARLQALIQNDLCLLGHFSNVHT